MLNNIKSVEMAEFFTKAISPRVARKSAVAQKSFCNETKIQALEREIESLQQYLENDNLNYYDIVETRNDILACKREIESLQNSTVVYTPNKSEKLFNKAIPEYQKTLDVAQRDKQAMAVARLNARRKEIESDFVKTNLIFMTDEDIKKCRKLTEINKNLINALKQHQR